MNTIMKKISLTALAAVVSVGIGTAAQSGETLDRVMAAGVLKIATDPNWPPMSFLNDEGKMDGFDVSVAREIAKRLGATAEFITPQWSVITAGSWNGRWDISVGSMTPTKERGKVLSFPGVYYYTPAVFAVHKDSAISSIADLNGKRIAASQATVYEQYLNKDLVIDAAGVPSFEFQVDAGEIKSYESSTTALDDLRLGDGVRVDGILGSLANFHGALEANYPIKVIGDPVFYEPLSIAIELGNDDFHAKLAGIVKDMHSDGTLQALSDKWFGIDYTSVVIE